MTPPPSNIPASRTTDGLNDRESLEALLDRLDQLAKRTVSPGQFFEELTAGILVALPAVSAVVWSEAEAGVQCIYRRQRPTSEASPATAASETTGDQTSQDRAAALLALQRETPLSLPPSAAGTQLGQGEELLNTTSFLQLFVPWKGGSLSGLVLQVALPPGASLSVRETATSLLQALAEVALTFRMNDQLRSLSAREGFWQEFDGALLSMHRLKDRVLTAMAIAEQVRRLTGADRVSVLQRRGSGCRLLATSAPVTVNRRSRQVKLLERLAGEALRSGQPVERVVGREDRSATTASNGVVTKSENKHSVLPSLDPYLDASETRAIRCVPLALPVQQSRGDVHEGGGGGSFSANQSERPIGMLVLEAFTVDGATQWEDRVPLLARHSAQALAHALDWQRTGWRRLLWPFERFSRTLLLMGFLVALGGTAAALSLVQTEFTVEAEGQLLPTQWRGIFAPSNAIVTEVRVQDGDDVLPGETLVVLEDPTLEQEWARLQGELQTVSAKLESVRARRSVRTRDREQESQNLAVEEAELKRVLEGLQPEIELLRKQRAGLTINSPIAGRVSGWELQQNLQSRTVQHGQRLFAIHDLEGPWRLELRVPHDVVGYVRQAEAASEAAVPVEFLLQSDATRTWQQSLTTLADGTELDPHGNLSVRATVDLPDGLILQPQQGATVLARLHCGQRSLGFVWFREVQEFVRKRILF